MWKHLLKQNCEFSHYSEYLRNCKRYRKEVKFKVLWTKIVMIKWYLILFRINLNFSRFTYFIVFYYKKFYIPSISAFQPIGLSKILIRPCFSLQQQNKYSSRQKHRPSFQYNTVVLKNKKTPVVTWNLLRLVLQELRTWWMIWTISSNL